MNTAAWLIMLLPLFSAAAIGLGVFRSRKASAAISVGAVVGSFLLTLLLVAAGDDLHPSVTWLAIGGLQIDIGLQINGLSKLMLCVVTGVGSLIHIFSLGYMKEDRDISRYFAFLSLFVFSMLGIVLADNFVMMFIFWELVGVSSYLLIGFWFEKPSAADAAKKAFLTNRVGDFGFLIGILVVWAALGSVEFGDLAKAVSGETAMITGLAGFLIFCGAMGKSAQVPLHVWLPDAMEGPTPVSALIHAATMVAAGVYMLCRVFFLIDGTWAMEAVAWIGGLTSLLAALMAVQQDDIKRILAYSTLSQLGYMVMAVGLGSPDAAMFHLTTHASFKALLFLGAGSVIVALHHEQDIWKMGGLRERMPKTYWTFLIGTMALCGVPLFSGFFSKEAILDVALENNLLLFLVAVFVALLTTFYMTRLFIVAFMGKPRSSHAEQAKESPAVMTVPLLVLAVPSVIAGYFNAHAPNPLVLAASLGVLVFGMLLANSAYSGAKADPLPARFGRLAKALRDRFWFDEIYQWLIDHVQENLAKLADAFDRWVIAGLLVRGAHGTTELAGRVLRLAQTGNLQTYAFWFAAGMAVLLVFTLS
ncbi:MAG: NADH-quinone oxidoreductase subunit L [Verrucomicrobia bacterium]|nr:NADH-quinone oxidoreductase subunit L [Verrucomicrobiota bacterium]